MSEFDEDDLKLIKELDAAEAQNLQGGSQQADLPDNGDAGNATNAQEVKASESEAAAKPQGESTEQSASIEGDKPSGEATQGEPHEDKPKGDIRAALRASRHAERQASKRLDAALKQVEELQAQLQNSQPAQKPALTEDQLAAIEEDFPEQAAAIRALQAQVEQLATQQPKQAAPKQEQAEFTPVILPAALQDAVDETPDLLAWQLNPDQTNFELAREADRLLDRSPKWAGKPLAERFAEVVRIVKEQTGEASAPTVVAPAVNQSSKEAADAAALAKAKAAIQGAKPEKALGISDLRGGTSPGQAKPDYSRMSDDEIIASL